MTEHSQQPSTEQPDDVDLEALVGEWLTVPDLAELRDLYELRVTLELRGIARAIEDPALRHDPAILRAQRARWEAIGADPPAPDASFVLLDEDFHTDLSRACGNRALTDSLVSVNRRIRRVRMYDFLTEDRIASTHPMPVKVRLMMPTMPTVLPEDRIACTSRNGRFSFRKSCTISYSRVLLVSSRPNTEYPISSSAKIAKNP